MKKFLLLGLAVVLLAFTACDATSDNASLHVPQQMRGTWVNDVAGQRIEATADNIVYYTGVTTMDFAEIIATVPEMYDVSYTDTTLDINVPDANSAYRFSVSGNTLKFTLATGGMSYPSVEFTKQ